MSVAAAALLPLSLKADTTLQGIEGSWQTSDSSCNYDLKLNKDFSWEDMSNQKLRSGVYIVFAAQVGNNKNIILSTTTDNFLPDCAEQAYSAIGTSQVLILNSSSNELQLSSLSFSGTQGSQHTHPIPTFKTLRQVDPALSLTLPTNAEVVALPPRQSNQEAVSENSADSPQASENTATSTIPTDRIGESDSEEDNNDAGTLSDTSQSAQQATLIENTNSIESQDTPFTGTPINRNDWVITRPENVSIGDHSNDYGFVNSQPNDTESIRVRIQQGSNWGTGSYFLLPPGVEEAWVGFCIRFPENWSTGATGKLPGFGGNSSTKNGGQGGLASNGNNAWSARMMFGAYDSSTDSVPLGQYIYHTAQSAISNYGDTDWWAPMPNRLFSESTRVSRSQWHSIKQRVRVNSKFTSNGIIETWVNGKKVYSRNNLNFSNNDSFREIYKFWLDTYHGGGPNNGHEQHVYYDQINYSIGSDKTRTNCGL